MAYNTPWTPREPDKAVAAAISRVEQRREPAPYGYLFRIEDVNYAGPLDEYDMPTPGRLAIEIEAIPIRSVTKCGWTIEARNGHGWRFVSRETRKRYALPTWREAVESFVARKERQASIYEARASKARYAIREATGLPLSLVK